MEEKSVMQDQRTITFTEFITKFIPFMVRIPYILYHGIKGLNMISGKKNISWGLLLEQTAEKYPDYIAIKSHEGTLTYKELNERANQFAHFLKSKNIVRGDTVTLCIDTRPELLVLYCGCTKIGAVCSLINVNQRGDSLVHSFNLNKGKIVVIGEECYSFFKEVESKVDLENSYLCFIRDSLINKLKEENDITDLLSKMPEKNLPDIMQITVHDPVAYIYTSGTTGGLPKAAVITNTRLLSGTFWWGRIVTPIIQKHTVYVPLPFFHTNAINIAWPPVVYGGASIAIRRKFSASSFVNDVKIFGATHFVYIGEVCRYLMAQPDIPGQDKTTLNYVIGNGLRSDIWKSFKKRYGIKKIFEFYGAAEGVGVFTNIMNFEYCVGMCLTPWALVKYDVGNDCIERDAKGNVIKVGKGETGLLIMQISKKTPFAGYTDKKKTEEKIVRDAFKNGDMWFNTGDMLRNMGYGQLQFVDRSGDTFRWKGENVATMEVEKALDLFPGIQSSAVYGVSMPSGDGKAGMAAIITDKNIDLKALVKHLRSVLPKYAIPLFIRFVDDFEKTATHKIKKTKLKNEGYNPVSIKNDLYVLLPEKDSYVPLTEAIYNQIMNNKYKF